MKEMGNWQVISFISRMTAMLIGLVQSFVIIRVLSVSEWGIIQLAVSIGSSLGVYQHLGLASASTREIASAKNDSDIFKIFFTSVAIRYFVTLPLAIGLFVFSHKLAIDVYHNDQLTLPLRIYGITLFFQGFQSILNSVISGTKRFKRLFIYQVVVSVINVAIFIPMVIFYRITGYFWAYLIFNIINTLILSYLAFKPLQGKITFPSSRDFKYLFREIFSISVVIYLVKILATNWEKLGTNVLGLYNKPELVAMFAFALLYARKIMSISDAVTDVNLPVMSEKYATDIHDFKKSFSKNFDKVFSFILLAAAVACFWAPEIIRILIGSNRYAASYSYIPYALLAFVIFSVIDIIKSSVLVPAKLVKEMTVSFVLLLVGTGLFYIVLSKFTDVMSAMVLALVLGATIALSVMLFTINWKLQYTFFQARHWALLMQTFIIGLTGLSMSLLIKVITFPLFLALLVWALMLAQLLSAKDLLAFKRVTNLLSPKK
jgi:O-antigen/teichoic acid export membrane protein